MIRKCKRCGHEWDYKGKQEWYCNCPRCMAKIRIKEYVKKVVTNATN